MTNKVGGSWQDFYFTESQHFYRKERKKIVGGGQIRLIYQKKPAHYLDAVNFSKIGLGTQKRIVSIPFLSIFSKPTIN